MSEEATADDKMGCWVAALQALSAVVTIFNDNIETYEEKNILSM